MSPQSHFRSGWMHQMVTRMWTFLLPAMILQSCIGSISGGTYLVHDEEGNYSIYFNGSHVLYYEDYYDENTTYELDYSPYETPATRKPTRINKDQDQEEPRASELDKNFTNSASHLLQGPLPFFFSLLHLLRFLLQDVRM